MDRDEIEIMDGSDGDEWTDEEVAEFEAETERMARLAEADDDAYWAREQPRIEAERRREYAANAAAIAEAEREAEEQIAPRRAGRPRVYDEPRQLVQIMLATELVAEIDAAAGPGQRTAWIERAIRAALSPRPAAE